MRSSFLAFVLLASPVSAETDAFCVENSGHDTHLFVTETREGRRTVQTLAPGETLCSAQTDADDGVVNVFEDENALEGCGRILKRGQTETFHAYAEFDRCEWGAHRS